MTETTGRSKIQLRHERRMMVAWAILSVVAFIAFWYFGVRLALVGLFWSPAPLFVLVCMLVIACWAAFVAWVYAKPDRNEMPTHG